MVMFLRLFLGSVLAIFILILARFMRGGIERDTNQTVVDRVFGQVGSLFGTQLFKPFKPSEPPGKIRRLSSPATRGRTKEAVERLERFEQILAERILKCCTTIYAAGCLRSKSSAS